jgi:hypothetical protein
MSSNQATYFSPLNILASIVITHYQCASLFVLVISQILIAERRSLSVLQRSMRTSESERSTLIPVRWSQARHQICTVDENPIMEWNDEYSKRYVG